MTVLHHTLLTAEQCAAIAGLVRDRRPTAVGISDMKQSFTIELSLYFDNDDLTQHSVTPAGTVRDYEQVAA